MFTKNITVILFTSIVYSICFGINEFVLPLYCAEKKVSSQAMGVIFGLGCTLIFFLRIYIGLRADFIGRKEFYSLGIFFSALSNIFLPFFSSVGILTFLRSIYLGSNAVRETLRSVLVFENIRNDFLKRISKIAGLEFTFMGIGTLLAGILVTHTGVDFPFYLIGILLIFTFIYFKLFYREFWNPVSGEKISFLKMFNIVDLPEKLKIIALSSFIFSLGVQCSHTFVMPLFFLKKFNASPETVAFILMIHRFSLGVPMFIFGNFIRGNLKLIYILGLIFQGVSISASAVIPNFFLATVVWLTHDIFGAAFWVPIHKTFIQEYAREENRAHDVSKVDAISCLGWIFGPLIAGVLWDYSINLPFFVSGIICILSTLPLLKL